MIWYVLGAARGQWTSSGSHDWRRSNRTALLAQHRPAAWIRFDRTPQTRRKHLRVKCLIFVAVCVSILRFTLFVLQSVLKGSSVRTLSVSPDCVMAQMLTTQNPTNPFLQRYCAM
jgi:hypothetical protein